MKISILIAICLSLFTASVAVFGTGAKAGLVHVVSSKQKDLFVFKVNKSWQGARVELIAPDGDVVSRQRLMKRKMIFNFRDMKPGTYKITVTKNHHTEEFQYIKK
jgi:hypothetical protein